jgi:hypothetical protein
MELDVLQNFKEVILDPYPHILISNALPEKYYNELDNTFPENIITQTNVLDNGKTYRYKSNLTLINPSISKIWLDFFAYHTSEHFFQKCISLFEEPLRKISFDLPEKLIASSVSVRNIDNSGDLVTDCQFVVHNPLEKNMTTRTPHFDNPIEIYAGLLYMKKRNDYSSGGNFVIYDQLDEIVEVNKPLGREVNANLIKQVKEVPYSKNTFAMFLNTKNSIHGVTPRINAKETRRSINIIGEFNGNGKMWDIKEVN